MTPEFSVIIPARDEESHLPTCLRSLRQAATVAGASLEIIVVLNRCTDRTEEIARSAGCTIVESTAKNLAAIRNSGAARATAPLLITIDADSSVSPNMLLEIRKAMSSSRIVGGAVPILPDRVSLGIFVTGLMLLPIALRNGISGGLFFTRRTYFEAIGGFDEAWVSAEDIDFAKRLKRYGAANGLRFAVLHRTFIVTSTRKFDRFGDWHFVKNFGLFKKLLRGRDQAEADRVWYDFPRS